MQPSVYQQAVYDFTRGGAGSASVNAVAGSGKTTTAVEMVKCFDPIDEGAFLAFNTHIAEELNERLGGVCPAMTYNALGWRALKEGYGKKIRLDKFKTQNLLRYEILNNLKSSKDESWYHKNRRSFTRLMSLVKAADVHKIELILPTAHEALARFDMDEPDGDWETRFIDLWKLSVADITRMDFDDQKYMAQHLMVDLPSYDYLVIDEYQDSCTVEANLFARACQSGRVFAIGDPDQAIYSFKGTTPDAMGQFVRRYNAIELPLSICYRCSKAVVLEARKYVPRIEYWDRAIEGAVDAVEEDDFRSGVRDGDFVLCRVTVDLVSSALRFLAAGRAAYVKGAEIGDQLISFIDQLATGDGQDAIAFYHEMEAYRGKRIAELEAMDRETSAQLLNDKCETITVLLDGVQTVRDVKKKISSLFADESSGIPHMTIHKSKGLETEVGGDVYLIAPEKIPHSRATSQEQIAEEYRLLYVAITRAKRNFFRVRSRKTNH